MGRFARSSWPPTPPSTVRPPPAGWPGSWSPWGWRSRASAWGFRSGLIWNTPMTSPWIVPWRGVGRC